MTLRNCVQIGFILPVDPRSRYEENKDTPRRSSAILFSFSVNQSSRDICKSERWMFLDKMSSDGSTYFDIDVKIFQKKIYNFLGTNFRYEERPFRLPIV